VSRSDENSIDAMQRLFPRVLERKVACDQLDAEFSEWLGPHGIANERANLVVRGDQLPENLAARNACARDKDAARSIRHRIFPMVRAPLLRWRMLNS
jgi:hypothetical protein